MIKKRVGMLLNIRTGVICGLTILIWLVLIDINYEICVEIVLTQHDNILVNYHHYSRPPSFRALERERERERWSCYSYFQPMILFLFLGKTAFKPSNYCEISCLIPIYKKCFNCTTGWWAFMLQFSTSILVFLVTKMCIFCSQCRHLVLMTRYSAPNFIWYANI
jgi:hypothetical protein